VQPEKGSESGQPQGTGTSTAPPAPPAPSAPPAPTAKPATCAHPNVTATVTDPAQVDEPEIAKQQGISGDVVVGVSLDANSHLTSVRIISTPSSLLVPAALSAAHQSKFQTDVVDCVPQVSEYKFTVQFSSQ
jgi:outer membrane biosynthesis protein TonB